ncbi:DNA polymerase III subunit tau [subsurface metagenome]
MISHQKQWQYLKKTAELGKTPHALLFYGQASIGKKTLASEFIKLLNCQQENFIDRPCQKCRSCLDIEKNVHPDLFVVEPQDNKEIKISQIRDLHTRLSLRSYSAPFKTVIINQAHCLNQEAQSAFLKLLEEPKGRTLFVLITEYPEMLLPTILSRVERLRFYSALKTVDPQEKRIKEILQIGRSDLAMRFQYAQKLSQEPRDLKEILDLWLRYFREVLLLTINNKSKDYSIAKLQRILRLIQTTSFLISTTNVNPRLALEMFMLEL